MKYLFLLLFTLSCSLLQAQTMNFLFKGTITNHFTVKPEAKAEVAIVQNGKKISNIQTDNAGNYTLRGGVSIASIFYVVFSKAGMVEKRIEFDFTKLNEEDVPAGSEYQPVKDLSSSIINDDPKYNLAFLKTEPVGKLTWNDKKMAVEVNEGIRENMRKKIDAALKVAGPPPSDAAKYQAAISAAQSFEKEQKYQQAITKYEEALTIRSTEKMPSDKIVELSALLAKSQKDNAILDQGNQQYMNLIVAAKALADQKKYQQAIDKYNEALEIKDDKSVLDQVKVLKGLLTDVENEQKYKDAIASADMFYNQKSYKTAKDKYTIATKLKPNEQHPKTRLADIEKKMADLLGAQEKKKLFDELVNEGDALFKEEKWAEAKAKYVESLKIESGATYSSEQLKECDIKLKEIADAQEKIANIQKWLKEGNDLFQLAKWADSKQKYTQVIGLEAENAVAKARLVEINSKIEEETKNAALNAQIAKLIADGDAFAKLQKLQEAKDKYSEAIKLKVDPLVQQKIDAIDKQLKDVADKKAKEAEFLALKTDGLKLVTEQKWEEAKTKLTAAKAIKPDPIIDAKLTEIEAKIKLLANQAKLEADYTALIAEAASKETANDLDGAIAKYKEALTKKATGKEALDKIKELDAKKAALATAAQNDALFAKLVGEGDAEFAAQKNTEAKAKFEQALKLKADPAVAAKLDNVNTALQAEKAKEAEFLALKTDGLKLATEQKWEEAKTKLTAAKALKLDATIDTKLAEIETKLKELEGQAKLDSEYKSLLSEASAKETANDLDGAIAKYKEALTKKATGKEALDKIKELEAKKAALASAAQNDALFAKLVGEGDAAFAAQKNTEAKSKFEQALKLKADPAVSSKLDNVNTALQAEKAKEAEFLALKTDGLKLATEQKWEEAKTKLTAAKALKLDATIDTKLAEIEAKLKALEGQAKLDSEYKSLLSEASAKETANDLDGAIAKYKEALSKKATGKEALDKIKELEAKKAALATAAQNDALFAKLVGEGDAEFAAQKNTEAKAKFEQALKLKADPAVAAKLDNVNTALQAEKAKEAEFLALKTDGLKLATEQKWEEAKTKLTAAKALKLDATIDTKLAEIETKLKELEGQAKLDSEYKSLLSEASAKETANDLDGAIAKYKEALTKKATGKEALDKIKELEGKKNAEVNAISEKYIAFIKSGDLLVVQKHYLEAIEEYKNALKVKENSKEAIDKIAEAQRLEQLNSSTQAKELLEKTIVAAKSHIDKEEYTKAKEILTRPFIKPNDDQRVGQMLQLIEEKIKQNEAYNGKMKDAELKVIAKDYKSAIELFEAAKIIKSSEKMPQKRIDDLNALLSQESSLQQKNQAVNSILAKGDEQKTLKKYNEAILSYNEALKLKKDDQLILDKIKEVKQLLDNEVKAKKDAVLAQQAIKVQLEKADKLFQTQKFEAAKDAYLAVQKLDPSNDYVNKQIQLVEENIAMLNQKKTKQAFDLLMKEGMDLFNSKSYLLAKEKFEKALALKPNDAASLKKLKEIDEILNPPLTAGELKPLGEAFDGSVLDGFAALQKAEEQRRYRSTNSIMDGVYATSKKSTAKSADKDLEHYETTKVIEKINQDKSSYGTETQLEIDSRLDLLQKTSNEQQRKSTEALLYVSNDQIKLREKITVLLEEGNQLSLDKMTSKQEEIYSLKATIDKNADRISNSAKTDATENVDDDKEIQGFIVQNSDKNTEKIAAKREVDNTVRLIQNATTEYLNVKDEQQREEEEQRLNSLEASIQTIDKQNVDDQQKKINDAYLATQNVSKNKSNQISKQAEKSAKINDFYKEIKDEQNVLSTEKAEKIQAKTDESNNVNSKLVDQLTKQKENEANKSIKQGVNSDKMKEISDGQYASSGDKSQKSNDKHIANQATINKAEMTKTQKVVLPNELGKTYEEGVTEESFAQKDDKGLMKAFITRRVVVIEGRGIVYIRTQTVQATTFTKDGLSITESTWQKDTQDPKLVKHKK